MGGSSDRWTPGSMPAHERSVGLFGDVGDVGAIRLTGKLPSTRSALGGGRVPDWVDQNLQPGIRITNIALDTHRVQNGSIELASVGSATIAPTRSCRPRVCSTLGTQAEFDQIKANALAA